MTEYKFIELPKDHISNILEICPQCNDTKTVSTPLQTVKLTINPSYRTECSKCKIWWETHKTEIKK